MKIVTVFNGHPVVERLSVRKTEAKNTEYHYRIIYAEGTTFSAVLKSEFYNSKDHIRNPRLLIIHRFNHSNTHD